LRSTEADIRRIMERSGSVSQVMDAELQLSQVREQIETLESQLKDMRTRVAYATIDIDLQAETSTAPVTPTAASQLASAWHTALASLAAFTVGILGFILWIVVFVPYLLAATLLVWLLARKLRPAVR
jgi:Flp pilus assembly protein TadB